ncbi:MAG: beta-propeller fold lactonase family protein [Aureispira sp.]
MKLLSFVSLLLLCLGTTHAQFSIQQYQSIRSPETSAISTDGQYFYVSESNGIIVYKIDATTRKLETLQTIKTKNDRGDVILTPDNKFILASSYGANAVVVYKRANDGKLSLHQSYTNIGQATLKKPMDLVLSPSGRYIFVTCDRTLFTFRFEAGQLTYVEQNTLDGSYHGTVYFSPDNKHVFIEDYKSGTPNCYMPILTLDESTGHLEVVGCLDQNKHYPIPNAYWDFFGERRQYKVSADLDYLAFSPEGKDVYMYGVENHSNGGSAAVMHYRWINGQLTLQKAYYGLEKKYRINGMKNIYLDGSGDYMYVLSGGEDSGIFIFKRNTITGDLTFVQSFEKLKNFPRIITPYRISFSQDNKAVYVSNYFGGNVMVLENKAGKAGPSKKTVVPPPAPIVNPSIDQKPIDNNPSNTVVTTNDNCEFPSIASNELARLENALQALATEQERYDYLLKQLQNRCVQTVQVLRLGRAFEVEYLRLEFVKFAYYYTADLENFYLLDTLFTSTRLKQSFKKYLEG